MTSEARERIVPLLFFGFSGNLPLCFVRFVRPSRPVAVGGIAALRGGGRPKGHFHLRLRLCGPGGLTSMTSEVRGNGVQKAPIFADELLISIIFKKCRHGMRGLKILRMSFEYENG